MLLLVRGRRAQKELPDSRHFSPNLLQLDIDFLACADDQTFEEFGRCILECCASAIEPTVQYFDSHRFPSCLRLLFLLNLIIRCCSKSARKKSKIFFLKPGLSIQKKPCRNEIIHQSSDTISYPGFLKNPENWVCLLRRSRRKSHSVEQRTEFGLVLRRESFQLGREIPDGFSRKQAKVILAANDERHGIGHCFSSRENCFTSVFLTF